MKIKAIKRIGVTILAVTMMFTLIGCKSGDSDVVRITHKNYTEQRLLGQVMSKYLESKGIKTKVDELGGSMLCFNALKDDKVDLYIEYTGTAYGAYLKHDKILSADETYDLVKQECEDQFGITWLDPIGFNNTYVLSVTPETAEKYNLKTISDLVPVSGELKLGSDAEFANRTDGLLGLKEAYKGLDFKEETSMDQGLTYAALNEGELDVNSSFSTDGRIAKYGFVNLEDDKNFFPPYYPAPIMKQKFADAHPEVVEAMLELADTFTEEDMQKYNLLVDEGAKTADVATQMLQDKGLID